MIAAVQLTERIVGMSNGQQWALACLTFLAVFAALYVLAPPVVPSASVDVAFWTAVCAVCCAIIVAVAIP